VQDLRYGCIDQSGLFSLYQITVRHKASLVPKAEVSGVLSSVGGIHNNVSLAGFQRTFDPDGESSPQFWINGQTGRGVETLVHPWDNHRQLVMLPDDGFLMAYQLAPRGLADGAMAWG